MFPPCERTGQNFLDFAAADECEVGEYYCHDCPAGCMAFPVWGTDRYIEFSSLCSAAAHAGTVDLAEGGRIYFQFLEWDDAYVGSDRNGIVSMDEEPWPVSIEFTADPGGP